MEIQKLIEKLRASGLYEESPCGCEFKLSDAMLFDGTKPFPSEALGTQGEFEGRLKKREDDLKKSAKQATEKARVTARTVTIGKNLEKIIPTMKDFKWALEDTRFLADPIDLITFDGLSQGRIDSISFIEVTGGKFSNQMEEGKILMKV